MTHSRRLALAAGALATLIVATLPACNSKSVGTNEEGSGGDHKGTRESRRKAAEAVVRASVKGEISTLSEEPVGVKGWTFLKVSLAERDGGPYFMVVKDDGALIKEDREAELAKVLKKMIQTRSASDPMALAAAMLLQPESCRLSTAARIEQMKGFTDDARLVPPAYDEGTKTLTFWTETLGRSADHTRYVVSGVGGALDVRKVTMQLTRAKR